RCGWLPENAADGAGSRHSWKPRWRPPVPAAGSAPGARAVRQAAAPSDARTQTSTTRVAGRSAPHRRRRADQPWTRGYPSGFILVAVRLVDAELIQIHTGQFRLELAHGTRGGGGRGGCRGFELCVGLLLGGGLRGGPLVLLSGQVAVVRSEEHTSELQSRENLVCRLL